VPNTGAVIVACAFALTGHKGWRAAYGLLLLTKLGAFGLLLLAAWNRWRAVPAMAAGDAWAAPMALRRSIAMEYLLMVAVMATTAGLTTFYSP